MLAFRGGINLKEYGSRAALSVKACQLTYLLDANFGNMADAGAPLVSPLAVDVGELTLVQVDGQFSINGGELVIPAQATPNWGDLGFYDATAYARAAGLVLLQTLSRDTTTQIGWHGWSEVAPPTTPAGCDTGTYLINAAGLRIIDQGPNFQVDTYSAATPYSFVCVLRNIGAYVFIKGGVWADWALLWIGVLGDDQTIFPALSSYDAAQTLALMRLASLADNATCPVPALGTRDLDLSVPGTGTGTSSIAAPVAGNWFTHSADAQIRMVYTTLPTLTEDFWFLWCDDASLPDFTPSIYLRINAAGNVNIGDYSGAYIQLALVAAALSNGDTLTIRKNDTSIVGHVNGSQIFSVITTLNPPGVESRYHINAAGSSVANLEARTLDGIANVASSNFVGYGLATDVLPGPRAAADTFTHEADCIIEVMLDALPTAGETRQTFRRQDDDNRWFWLYNAGSTNFQLVERIAAANNIRATIAGVLAGGERITIICDGGTIKGYYDTTLAWTYAAATNFSTETSGEILSLGTGGEVSDIITRPLYLAASEGAELLANGDFSAWTGDDPDGWTVTGEVGTDPEVSEVGSGQVHGGAGLGSCNLYSSVTNYTPRISQDVLVIGRRYRANVVISSFTGSRLRLTTDAGADYTYWTSSGTYAVEFVATATIIELRAHVAASDITVDSVGLVEITYGAPNTPEAANIKAAFDLMATP